MKKQIIMMIILAFAASCTSPGKKTATGAGIGAAAGAGLGALMGSREGNAGKGALIGAALGALAGGAIGNHLDKQAKELEQIAETKRTDDGIITKLKGDILFDSGKSELKPAAQTNINQLAAVIKKYPEDRLTISGYTDSRGSAAINQKISEERARAVMNQLVAAGVPASTIQAVGRGPASPIAPNNTPDGQAKNRRVEIEVRADPNTAQN